MVSSGGLLCERQRNHEAGGAPLPGGRNTTSTLLVQHSRFSIALAMPRSGHHLLVHTDAKSSNISRHERLLSEMMPHSMNFSNSMSVLLSEIVRNDFASALRANSSKRLIPTIVSISSRSMERLLPEHFLSMRGRRVNIGSLFTMQTDIRITSGSR